MDWNTQMPTCIVLTRHSIYLIVTRKIQFYFFLGSVLFLNELVIAILLCDSNIDIFSEWRMTLKVSLNVNCSKISFNLLKMLSGIIEWAASYHLTYFCFFFFLNKLMKNGISRFQRFDRKIISLKNVNNLIEKSLKFVCNKNSWEWHL